MLSRLKFKIEPLVDEILNKIPEPLWTSKTSTFLDPAMGGGQFVSAIEAKLRKYGHSDNNIAKRVFGCEEYERSVKFAIGKHNLIGTYYACNFLEENWDMKFNVILGNPPYQDGTKKGGQNKIYNQISKRALTLLKDDGIIAFITPTSVLKKNKRFSIIGLPGLTYVDFTADNYFTVGINICSWQIDKTYSGPVTVEHANGTTMEEPGKIIYNYAKADKTFTNLYESLKAVTDKPAKRMFRQNAVATDTGRSLTHSTEFNFPVYKIVNNKAEFVQYNKPVPKFYNMEKFIISMTKGFNDKAIIISNKDFDVAHLCIDIDNNSEVDNIKSFIFCDYFKEHSQKWKKLDGYGYNYSLKHLPPFDKTKSWTNDEVKEFLESFVK